MLVSVDKIREIYLIENVKFHLDSVAELGSFIEIEAMTFCNDATPIALFLRSVIPF
jgi:adenylate cyclase class IV